MTISARWINEFYSKSQYQIKASSLGGFHNRMISVIARARDSKSSLLKSWMEEESSKGPLQLPVFMLATNPCPQKYFLEELIDTGSTTHKRLGEVQFKKRTDGGVDLFFQNLNRTHQSLQIQSDIIDRIDPPGDYLSHLMRHAKGCLFDQTQLRHLMWFKWIVNEFSQSNYSKPVLFQGRDVTECYQGYLNRLLTENFLDYGYVFSDPYVLQQFVISCLPPSRQFNAVQSICMIQIAAHTCPIMDLLQYLSTQREVYSSCPMDWTMFFFKWAQKDQDGINKILAELFKNERPEEHSENKKALLENVITGLRNYQRLISRQRDELSASLLDYTLAQVLLILKAPPLNKNEKYIVRDYAIAKINAVKDDKMNSQKPIQILEALYDQYTSNPMITTRRHSRLDAVASVFRFFFTPYKKDFFGDTEIRVRKKLNQKLEEFKGEEGYHELFKKFNAEENLDRMKTVLPVTGSPLRNRLC